MVIRSLAARIPIWARVSGIIALVLVGVLVSTVLLDTTGVGGGHQPPGDGTQVDRGGHGGDHRPPGDDPQLRDHTG